MTVNTEKLKALREQTRRKSHLTALRNDLADQQRSLTDKTASLKASFLKEQQDVEKLEGKTLAAMLYDLLGKKEDKLTKEKREASAARLKYEAAARELESVEFRLRSVGEELQTLRECEADYANELQRVLTEIKTSGDPRADALLSLEARIADRQADMKELSEALAAGSKAMESVNAVLRDLDDAESWGTWDLFGGGLLADIAKHDALESAQRSVDMMQVQLRSFKTELVDVEMELDVQVTIDGFLGFADWFFDGFFADYAVMDKIDQSVAQVREIESKLRRAMNTLNEMNKAAEADIAEAEEAMANLAMEG